ncbi:MAG: hypothetical protein KGY61_05995 [Desulfobacterales bacterium]|nr:hypothetical protein [Desulfobacterales bacterium]
MAKIFNRKASQTGRQGKTASSKESRKDLQVKRCPECFINLPIDAKECFSCHAKVGAPNKHGVAKKRGDWIHYVTCVVAWAIFIAYLKWAFF